MSYKKIVIIGAGPAGLTAAYEILKSDKNFKVEIYEETNVIGGISQTVNNNGNRMDIGGHRFFSKSDKVMNFWLHFMPQESETLSVENTDKVMLIRNRLSRIFFLKKLFNYPVTLTKDLIFNLGFFRCTKIGFSYIKYLIFPCKNVDSLEKFYINRFGKELYNLFFRDYTEKVWGVKPSELSPDWGAQRVKGLSVWKTIINALKPKNKTNDVKQKGVETSLIEKFLYPKYGPGQLWETVAKEIENMGGKIYFDKKIEKIKIENNKVVSITSNNNETIYNIDYLISTMPVKDLIYSISLLNEVPEEVKTIASKLQYRDFITVGLLLKDIALHNKDGIVKDNWIYIQEPYVKVARLQLFNNWSPYMVADTNLYYVGMEYMCSENDELWSMNDNEFKRFAIEEMKSLKLIKDKDIVSSNIIKIKKAYPSYTGVYNEFYKLREYIDEIKNLFLIGRNGMHKYNNMDHSMLTAMEAVNCIINNNLDKRSIWDINTEKEYHEEKIEEKNDQEKKNVDKYNIDVKETGKYLYNNEKLLSHYYHLKIYIDTITKMYDFNNKEILEIGCGDGIYTLELAKEISSLKVLATEPSEEGIISAKRTQEKLQIDNVIFDTLNVYDLEIDKKYDAILFNVVLHHLSDPEKAINMVSNFTDTIIIVEPNGYSPALKILEKFSKYHIEHEERSFFMFTIKKWLINNDFYINKYKFRAILPMFCPNWFAKLLYFINPIFQSIPILNKLSCGKVFIVANKIQTRPNM